MENKGPFISRYGVQHHGIENAAINAAQSILFNNLTYQPETYTERLVLYAAMYLVAGTAQLHLNTL